MGSKQVANDTIKLLGAVMLLLFVLPWFLTMVDCAGVVTGLHEPEPDPYADFEVELERAIEQAEAREQARFEKRYGKTGNGRTERAIGAYYGGADEAQAASDAPGAGSMLLMAGGLLVSVLGCFGALGFLFFGGSNAQEDEGPPAEPVERGADVLITLDDPVPSEPSVSTRPTPIPSRPEDSTFDEYGRPADYEPAPLEGYWTHLALVALVGGSVLVLLLIGPMNLAIWLGLTFG